MSPSAAAGHVDRVLFARLYSEGMPYAAIADACGCTVEACWSLRSSLALPARRPVARPDDDQPVAATSAAPVLLKGGDQALYATQGRYAALAEYAAAQRITMQAALQRWHRLRAAPAERKTISKGRF